MSKRLWFALLMPIVLILLVLAMIHLPKRVHPTQDFIFTLSENPFCAAGSYRIERQKVVWQVNKKLNRGCDTKTMPLLYRYDIQQQQAALIKLNQTKTWGVDPSLTSTQGFEVVNASEQNFLTGTFPFSGRFQEMYYLKGQGYSEAIQLPEDQPPTMKFTFLGWIQL